MTLYTSNDCSNCQIVKAILEKRNVLDKVEIKNIENKEYKKELMKRGYMAVPLLVSGDKEILGLNKEEIEEAIKEEFDV